VAFLGFDAAEPTLVERGVEEGWLPTLARLLEGGCSVRLGPVPSGFYNTSWTATMTGTDVGDHGAVLDRRLDPGSYRIVDAPASTLGRPPFWRYLSDAGVRSTVVSIYSAPAVPGLRGTQVQGWGTIDPYFAKFDDRAFDPPEIEQLLRGAVRRRHALYRVTGPRTSSECRRYRDLVLESIDQHTRGLAALVDATEWDFFFGSFAESHHAGHLIWHLGDPRHPSHDPDASADVKDALTTIYRAIDKGIGVLLERLPDDCRVFVLTPHGMGPNYIDDPTELLLERGGWLVRHSSQLGGGAGRALLHSARAVGRRVLPPRLRRAVRSRLPQSGVLASMPLLHVDWSRTRAFALPSDMTSYVRINLAGREPEGIVRPGEEYDRLCDELVSAFGALVHAETGLPAAERVLRCDALIGRPVDGALPDVFAIWPDDLPLRHLRSPTLGSVQLPFQDPRTGQHRRGGFMLGAGPGIPARGQARLGEPAGTLLDIAPTALALLGVDRPPGLVGQPIEPFTASMRDKGVSPEHPEQRALDALADGPDTLADDAPEDV
jgi:predicted AlkP superfamily phosphohydrolase/phosphomutase